MEKVMNPISPLTVDFLIGDHTKIEVKAPTAYRNQIVVGR